MIAAGMISAALLILLVVKAAVISNVWTAALVGEVPVFMASTKEGLRLSPSKHLFS